MQRFPPVLENGTRVWTETGYPDHGPLEGPKQDIPGPQGGTVVAINKPWLTMDQLLYTIQWDSGHESKHYGGKLCSIGRFRTRLQFEDASRVVSLDVVVGPKGGFRSARYSVEYDGNRISGQTFSREDWRDVLEPLAKRDGVESIRSPA